jgi:hypothetical protein
MRLTLPAKPGKNRYATGKGTSNSCRIGPARVERTLLSAAFDLDLDSVGCTHGPLQGRGRAALQRPLFQPPSAERWLVSAPVGKRVLLWSHR